MGEHKANLYNRGNYPLTVGIQSAHNFAWVEHYTPKGRSYKLWEDLSEMIPVRKEYLWCSFYVYPDLDSAKQGQRVGGSGFMVSCQLKENATWFQPYAVTNWHVIEKCPNPVLRVNTSDGGCDFIPTNRNRWHRHPNGVDLAALPFDFSPAEYKYICVGTEDFLTKEVIERIAISPGDEIYMIGRFVGADGEQKNTPAVRFGNIAMLPSDEQENFLIDCKSIPGYSGSPVFLILFPPMPRPPMFATFASPVYNTRRHGPFLLGVDSLHLQNYEQVLGTDKQTPVTPKQWVRSNTGMAEVIPAWRLAELVDLPEFVEMRRAEDEKITANREPEPSYKAPDSAKPETQTTEEGLEIPIPTEAQVTNALKKASRKKH